jgi:hypothetical protein
VVSCDPTYLYTYIFGTPDLIFHSFVDFIYADNPFHNGDNGGAYKKKYRRNYASDSYRQVYEKLRTSLFIPQILAYQNA